jgi:GH15 family glucan-1,4-alpha-glucosidase
VGASAGTHSKVWFTVARGITSEIFYPRLDVPNMEDMQYIITGRVDIRRSRARRHKPCDFDAD